RVRLFSSGAGPSALCPLSLHDALPISELVNGQAPFAIILGCSDSRAPAELIFDQGLGDLFVIRVAGNIVAPSLVGSVEFAATRRSEEHTSELQSRENLVCRLLLKKKNK